MYIIKQNIHRRAQYSREDVCALNKKPRHSLSTLKRCWGFFYQNSNFV